MVSIEHGGADQRTIFAKQIIGTTDNELVDQSTQLLELGITGLFLLVRRIRISTSEDFRFKILFEIYPGSQIFGIGKVE